MLTLGGLVHSTGSGLSVPDWPTTYGQNMFTYPVSEWTGGIKYEHGHRLFASFVGFLVIIELVWLWGIKSKSESRFLRKIGVLALIAVSIQGILGGLTVHYQLPTAISASHGLLAQMFLVLTVLLAMATSDRWQNSKNSTLSLRKSKRALFAITFVFTLVQILLGALTRHTYSGMAIPDFPLAFGTVVPDFSLYNYQVVIHYLHRVGAVILTILSVAQFIAIIRGGDQLKILRPPMVVAIFLIGIQITLGGLIVLTVRDVIPNTLHVTVGSLLLICHAVTWINSIKYFKTSTSSYRTTHVENPSLDKMY
ncbi:MAG: heme A synthase [Ignavibacteria bacterium]|nr:heme A synthase [Ignavibacteria bacterium]